MFGSDNQFGAGGVSTGFYDHTIDQSLRFNDNDSPYLSRTFGTPTNAKVNTISFWYKRGNLNTDQRIFTDGGTGPYVGADNTMGITRAGVGTWRTVALLRDPSAWYHVVFKVDTTQATASNRIKIYLNGELQTGQGQTIFSQNESCYYATSGTKYISGPSYFIDGCIAEFNFVDGQALDPTSFGEEKSGVWIPKAYSGSYGNNGFHLEFANSGSLGTDTSGNGNNWTPTNLASTDQVLDSPTNNFATFSAITKMSTVGLYEGSTKINVPSGVSHYYSTIYGSMGASSGKWYWEVTTSGSNDGLIAGIDTNGYSRITSNAVYNSGTYGYRINNGVKWVNGTSSDWTSSSSVGDVIGIAIDMDAGTFTAYKNNVLVGTLATGISGSFVPLFQVWYTVNAYVNFGQDSSFAGLKTAQGNTDANGIGDFYYAPPSGYLALCTANLPEPAISPLDDASPSDHFIPKIWTGNGATSGSITGVPFSPDLVWVKNRSAGNWHTLGDTVRGTTKLLFSNATNGESTNDGNGYITAFNSDGFSYQGGPYIDHYNGNGYAYIGWMWDMGSSTTSNSSGSITSSVRANTDAGMSVVGYTGTGSVATVGHGLGQAPDMIIIKARDYTTNWPVYNSYLGATHNLILDQNVAQGTTAAYWNNTEPTSSVFTINNAQDCNRSGNSYVAYCFAEKEGFSKFGSYIGNGSSDGPFVYTGFKPAFVMVKRTDSTGSWHLWDNARSPDNVVDNLLIANGSGSEVEGATWAIDYLSNGFKLRIGANTSINASGGTHIYMAFAENPFKYANAR